MLHPPALWQRFCTGNYKCSRAGVRCTRLCKCESGCVNNDDTYGQNCFYIPSDSPPKEDTVYNCECSLNRQKCTMKIIQGGPKNLPQFFFLNALTLPNINRFLTLFYSQNQEKICNNTVAKDSTTPQVCRYTTL